MEKTKELKRRQTGITLIALVITIIVLLILAGVSIATLTGNNGILTQAKLAKENSITTYAAHLKGEEYNKGVFEKNVALLIGNEAKGLSDEVSGKADRLIKIPMEGKVESLNAAIATAILMYQCIDV